MVGAEGRVICVDLQEKVIAGLLRRARRAGVAGRLVTRVCSAGDLGLAPFQGSADLALAVHVVHEVPDQGRFLAQVQESLRPGGLLLIVEPRGHVTPAALERTLATAASAGLERTGAPFRGRGLGAVLRKRVA